MIDYIRFNRYWVFINVLITVVFWYLYNTGGITCWIKSTSGLLCSTCGMSRDFMSYLKGDFSTTINPNSKLLFGWLVSNFIWRLGLSFRIFFNKIMTKLIYFDLIIFTSLLIYIIYKIQSNA